MRESAGQGSAASALVPVSPAPLVDLVLDSLASGHSRRAYGRALGEFFAWYAANASGEGFTRATLQRYRSHLLERNLSAGSPLSPPPGSAASPAPAAPESGPATG